MSSLIVVHGTGVRGSAYEAVFRLVEAKLQAYCPNVIPVRCLWGDQFGAKLPAFPRCIPGGSDRSVTDLSQEDMDLQLWAQLYADPLAELRFVGAQPEGGNWDVAEIMSIFRATDPTITLANALHQLSWQNMWSEARGEITSTRECRVAAAHASDSTFVLRRAVSRAIVATITVRTMATGGPVPDEILREIMVAEMISMFLPEGEAETPFDERSLGDVSKVMGDALWYGVQWISAGFLERKRLADAAIMTPMPGDIILYQSPHGDLIREFIAATIRSSPKPRYVLAHSLGSVAAVDVLVKNSDLEVEQLFTIGSPTGLFHEMNALVSLSSSEVLPPHFPRWLNIYDPRDLISYLARPVFNDDPRVSDESHESGQPLLAAHSAYWASDTVWSSIGKAIPQG